MKEYDFIIAGGGVSGLSLAYHLVSSSLAALTILIVDSGSQGREDHALSFWSREPTPFPTVILRSWDRLRVRADSFDRIYSLGSYHYHTLRWADDQAFIRQELAKHSGVNFVDGSVDSIEDDNTQVRVIAGGQEYSGKWAFDSRFRLAGFHPDTRRYPDLRQHFRGWQIETRSPAFDPQTATLFDFRIPQEKELRFLYTLPFTEQRALVELVTLGPVDYDAKIRRYVEETLGISDYTVLSKEGGVTPLTAYPFPRQVGRRVLTIGIPGGRVKSSSGYAFTRIQRDSAAIVDSLVKTGSPFNFAKDKPFYRFCDDALLQTMSRHGEYVQPIFLSLFKNNPIERVLQFLDEINSPGENLALMLTLPLPLFMQGLLKAAGQNLGTTRRSI
jgi:lycopene beta-cyclase